MTITSSLVFTSHLYSNLYNTITFGLEALLYSTLPLLILLYIYLPTPENDVAIKMPCSSSSPVNFDDFSSPLDWSDDSSECDGYDDESCSHCEHDESHTIITSSDENRRSVRFSQDANEVIEILHICDYTLEEANATWYQIEDYERMNTDTQETLHMMCNSQKENKNPHANHDHTHAKDISTTTTIRGLEFRSGEGSRKRRQNKRLGLNAVLEEQRSQWKAVIQQCQPLGDDVPLKIAQLYQAATSHCQCEALLRGLKDEQEAINIHVQSSSNSNCPTVAAKHEQKIAEVCKPLLPKSILSTARAVPAVATVAPITMVDIKLLNCPTTSAVKLAAGVGRAAAA